MNSSTTLSRRSRLVDAANSILPVLWKTRLLERPQLDAQFIGERVRKQTGLVDFGDSWFHRPLHVLTKALREEAGLNAIGQFGAYGQLKKVMRDRLRAQYWFDRHPEIEARAMPAPVIVVGPMRSGTTRLHRLLAADTRFAHLRLFETICPIPAPGFRRGGPDRRWLAAAAILGSVHRFNPNTAHIHPTGPFEPEEELGLLVQSVWGMKHEAQWRVPSYGQWSEWQDATPAYRHMARLLRLVGWARDEDDSRPWVLKTPQHMLDLPALLNVFPDARIVFTHRAPRAVVGSSCSLVWNQSIIHSDDVDPAEIGGDWLRKTDLQIQRMRSARLNIPESQRIDVHYDDVERDWAQVMRRIYDFLDMDIEPALFAMTRYTQDSEQERHRYPHRYELSDFGLGAEEVSERFRSYTDEFALDEGAPASNGKTAEPIPFPDPPTRRFMPVGGWKTAKAAAARR